MEVKILGSGSWEGIPVPFCDCVVCHDAKRNIESKNNRTRPEIWVKTDEGSFLIEISPDIRVQSTRFDLPIISDFLLTHWHFDHMYGLLELDAYAEYFVDGNMKLYASEETKNWINDNFSHIPDTKVIKVDAFESFVLYGVRVTPFPVFHMKSQDESMDEDKLDNTVGYLLEKNDRKIAYLSDCYKLPKKSLQLLQNVDIAIIDGTFLFEDEFPDKIEQNEIKSEPDHLHGQEIIDFANTLNAKKIILHSISHLTEKIHDELQQKLSKNIFISYDGMEL